MNRFWRQSFRKAAVHLLRLQTFTSVSPKPPTAFRFPDVHCSQAAKDSESNSFCWFNCSCTSHLEFHFTNCRCAKDWKSRPIGANKSHTFECKNTHPGFKNTRIPLQAVTLTLSIWEMCAFLTLVMALKTRERVLSIVFCMSQRQELPTWPRVAASGVCSDTPITYSERQPLACQLGH